MDWLKLAQDQESALIEDLKQLIAIPSLLNEAESQAQAPFGLETRRALDFMLDLAQKDGFKTHDLAGYAGIIEYGEGEEIVGVLGHLDVVPTGTGWRTDPFTGVVDRGYLFGRGAMDDKGPTMAAYYALKIIKQLALPLNKKIYLILGCDEETGMRCMEYYLKNAPIPQIGFVPDADFPVIYGEKGIINIALKSTEPTVIQTLKAGERPNIVIGEATATVAGSALKEQFESYLRAHNLTGQLTEQADQTSYTIVGEAAHGSLPETGNNAGLHLISFIAGAYNDAYAIAINKLLSNYYGKGLNILHFGTHMGYLTMNVGQLDITQDQQTIILDIRYPHDFAFEQLMDNLIGACEAVNPNINVDVLAHSKPLFVDPNSSLVKTLVNCYQSITKDEQSPAKTIGGGTYARCFENFVAFGPEFAHLARPDFVGQVHQANEGISLKELMTATAIYAKALAELAG